MGTCNCCTDHRYVYFPVQVWEDDDAGDLSGSISLTQPQICLKFSLAITNKYHHLFADGTTHLSQASTGENSKREISRFFNASVFRSYRSACRSIATVLSDLGIDELSQEPMINVVLFDGSLIRRSISFDLDRRVVRLFVKIDVLVVHFVDEQQCMMGNARPSLTMSEDKEEEENCCQEMESEICTICLEDLSETEGSYSDIARLPCSHVFHKECIEKWLSNSSPCCCPLCRYDLLPVIS